MPKTLAPPTPTPEAVAPPQMSAPMPSVDLSGLVTPATQPTVQGTQEFQSAVTGENDALKRVQELAKPEAPAAPVPHARLLSMVQGLATGLSAFGSAIATGGREGGEKEVAQIQGEQQQQKIQAQQAAAAQKNTQIQQQLMVANTAHTLGQNILMMDALPDEITLRHLAAAEAQTRLAGEKQSQAIQGADFALGHGLMSPQEVQDMAHSTTPLVGQTGKGAAFVSTDAQQTLGKAQAAALPDTDPFVHNLQQKLKDPSTTPGDLMLATGQLKNQLQRQSEGTDEKIKREAAEAAARPKDINDATGRVTAADKDYRDNPTPATAKAKNDARNALSEFQRVEREKKVMEQDVTAGDPTVLAETIFSGGAPPSMLITARNMMSKPNGAIMLNKLNALAKADGAPELLGPNGSHTGNYFDLGTANLKYAYASDRQTQDIMNKIRTLNEKGGDKDILLSTIKSLPKMNQTDINALFNIATTHFGSPAVTRFHMALSNFASLMATVQTGGIPTDSTMQEQMNLLKDSFSAGQFAGGLDTASQDITARGVSMLKGNRYLQAAYPDIASTTQDQSFAVTAPDGSVHTFKDQQGVDTFKKLAGIK